MRAKTQILTFVFILCSVTYQQLCAQLPNVVIDGKTRFTILTPTLIRTEYSGDGIFEDRRSYNVAEHNLSEPTFSTRVQDEWLEIETDKLLLRYKQNSGAFAPNNLTVKLKEQDVTTRPWVVSLDNFREEAEKARLYGGAKLATDHVDYDGSGFVAGLKTVGAGMEWSPKTNWQQGEYTLSLKYSNGMGSDRTITLYVDNVKTQILLPQTANWDKWSIFNKKIILDAGPHSFRVVGEAEDNFNVNIDWISISRAVSLNEICEAENALFSTGPSLAREHAGYSGNGFLAGFTKAGASVSWDLNCKTAGDYMVSFRYANGLPGDGQHITRTLSLYVNDTKKQVSFPITNDWKTWGVAQFPVTLTEGLQTIRLVCDAGDTYRVNIDWMTVTKAGEDLPQQNINQNLGAWSRGLDEKKGAIPMWDGILSRNGWYLLNDSETALHDGEGWVTDRPAHNGGYQDGYFFGYGTDYQLALKEFYKLTGNPVMLPKWAFGVWYSINDANFTTSAYYQDNLLPLLRSQKIPLDVLVVDTDWKSPYRWNSWDWNKTAFPDPQNFFNWAKEQGLVIPLNLHPTIQGDDAKFTATNNTAGGLILKGGRYHFDFTNKKHAQAYFDLHKPFDDMGVRFWWFDQAEEPNSVVSGVPADTWINGLYREEAEKRNLRGFAFSRIGSGHAGYNDNRKPGIAWSEHRYTVHFTGDTYNTWDMLAFQSAYTIKEGNIGIPYVTHDLGSYHGDLLSDDMYMRWVQFGTFQPVFRLHSKRGKRLPWQYPNVAQEAKEFIRLRHALVPYTYTLAHESATGGLPIVRGLYFYYPSASEAYTFDKEYFYGEKMLVAPIASPGENASVQMWFPEGKWTNFFTQETVTGPVVKSVSADYSSMPVFVKEGGIIPLAPYSDFVGQTAEDSLRLKVYAGKDGAFSLYNDEGENLNYKSGKHTVTRIEYSEFSKTLSIKAQAGQYEGAPAKKSYSIEIYNSVIPEKITLNGCELPQTTPGAAEGWWVSNSVVNISTAKYSVDSDLEIRLEGVSTVRNVNAAGFSLNLYPNPVTDELHIELENNDDNEMPVLCIYSALGMEVLGERQVESPGIIVDTASFSKGMYLLKAENGTQKLIRKFIIE